VADIAEELKTYLKTKVAITSKIGSGVAARIYTDLAKQNVELAFIVFEIFEGSSAECLNEIAGICSNRIQIDAYGATSDDAWELAESIRLAPLQMYRGMMGDTFVNNVSSEPGYRRGYDQATKGGNQRRYWISRDFTFTYEEAVIA
jgi:hypothetical protein